MSAAQAREELEAAFWRHWPLHRNDFRAKSSAAIAEILSAADAYADAVAGEGSVDRVAGPSRLAEAAAEAEAYLRKRRAS